jgi:hypothetical protein
MYEEVRDFCHQWNHEEHQQPILSADQPQQQLQQLPYLGGAVRNLSGSLELVVEPPVDYLPPLTIEELSSDPLLYSDDQQQQQQLMTADSWTDCLQLSPEDLPDWMETDTLTTLQFPSLFSLG